MKTSTIPLIDLSENHRRSISITLQLVDKALCEWNDWANGQVQSGVMYSQRDTFSEEQNRLENSFGRKLLNLDRRIRNLASLAAEP